MQELFKGVFILNMPFFFVMFIWLCGFYGIIYFIAFEIGLIIFYNRFLYGRSEEEKENIREQMERENFFKRGPFRSEPNNETGSNSSINFSIDSFNYFIHKCKNEEKIFNTTFYNDFSNTNQKEPPAIKFLILDGSNISCWRNPNEKRGNLPILFTLINEILKLKIQFHIFFDANIQYILYSETDSKETLSHAFKSFLSLFPEKITIVPARNRADDFILQKADRDGAHIISNDTYKQYLDEYPWLAKGDRVLGGTIIDNRLSIPLLRIDPIVTNYAFEGIELIKSSISHSKYSTRNSQQQQSSVSI